MSEKVLFVGLDVDDKAFHGHFMSEDGKLEGSFSCKPSIGALEKKLFKLQQDGFTLRICYEATYLGFSLHRDLSAKGYLCDVIAPSLVPQTPGDQVKTDRLDSRKLAQCYRSGLLTVVNVPDTEDEIIRDLLRSRKFLSDQMASIKVFITALCRRMGLNYKEAAGRKEAKYWTDLHVKWLRDKIKESKDQHLSINLNLLLLQLEQIQSNISSYTDEIERISKSEKYNKSVRALCCYRGIDILSAMTLIVELGDIKRFDHPKRLASYAGMDLREYSSGGREKRFGMTKTGNRHVRTVVIEASQFAWQPVRISKRLKVKRLEAEPELVAIADRCMSRLHSKATRLLYKGKTKNKVKVACARELLCFVWESLNAVKAA